MKILHVYKSYAPTPGGIETHVRQLAVGLARRGADVTVLTTSADRRTVTEVREGVRVIRAGRLGEIASTPLSPRLVWELARADADVVHLHVPYPVGEVGYLLAGRRRPLVVTYHSDVVRQRWARPLYDPLLTHLLRRAHAIVATSPVYVETSPVLRQFATRCNVIPLGVDLDQFSPTPEFVAAIRQRWLDQAHSSLVLFVGRFRAYKGLEYLIDAVAGLPACLLLIGAGPLEGELRATIAQLGLGEQVAILGNVRDEDLPAYYAACDVFVLPSIQRSEAFGTVLLEAMAAGRPAVCTELGTATSWVVQNEVTGLVVPPADSKALKGALERLLSDRTLARRLGEAARQRAEEYFGEGTLLDNVEKVYRQVVGDSK
jgi:rhamnosyl/mannosyltransferase